MHHWSVKGFILDYLKEKIADAATSRHDIVKYGTCTRIFLGFLVGNFNVYNYRPRSFSKPIIRRNSLLNYLKPKVTLTRQFVGHLVVEGSIKG